MWVGLPPSRPVDTLKNLGKKAMFFHQPGTLKHSCDPPFKPASSWAAILLSGCFPLPSHQLLGDKWGFPCSGMGGLLAHTTAILLPACLPQVGRSQFSEEFNKIWILGKILIWAFGSMMRCLSYCALFKRYWINLNKEWMKETVIWSVCTKRVSLSN